MTVALWNKTQAKMLPTPAKFHYLFNMRELSKVFQGVMLAARDRCALDGVHCSVHYSQDSSWSMPYAGCVHVKQQPQQCISMYASLLYMWSPAMPMCCAAVPIPWVAGSAWTLDLPALSLMVLVSPARTATCLACGCTSAAVCLLTSWSAMRTNHGWTRPSVTCASKSLHQSFASRCGEVAGRLTT